MAETTVQVTAFERIEISDAGRQGSAVSIIREAGNRSDFCVTVLLSSEQWTALTVGVLTQHARLRRVVE